MKSALVIGASRGIGRQIALTLSRNGYWVGVAAKTVTHSSKLPGTIHSVAEEIESAGGSAFPIQCNVRDAAQISRAVNACIERFAGLDLVVYNAGAILWKPVIDTPLKRFDLMWEVNVRGAYATLQAALPHMLRQRSGTLLLVAPPIYNRFFKGKVPYSVTKVGMTVLVHGLANELRNTGVSVSSLWPATTEESHVTRVRDVPKEFMRKPTIFADACLKIAQADPESVNGKALIDEDYLRSCGVNDFSQYRCDPDAEPPRIMPKIFPSLLVEEEDVNLTMFDNKSNL